MKYQNATVVYYDNDGQVAADYIMNINQDNLQKVFNKNIAVIKNITIENQTTLESKYTKFKTLFTEVDIRAFLDEWEIEF